MALTKEDRNEVRQMIFDELRQIHNDIASEARSDEKGGIKNVSAQYVAPALLHALKRFEERIIQTKK